MIDSYKVKITLREKGLLATPVRYVFFWLNILVKPKVTVGLEANEVNLMIIQIRLCLLSNTRWQCSYNSIRKKNKIIAGPQCCLSLITQVIIRAHVFCNSVVRNEKKIKKNKTKKNKQKEEREGKRKEEKIGT